MDRRDPSIHLGGGNGGTMNEEGCESVRGKFLTGRAIYNLGGGTPRGFKLAGFRGSRGVVLYGGTCVCEAVITDCAFSNSKTLVFIFLNLRWQPKKDK